MNDWANVTSVIIFAYTTVTRGDDLNTEMVPNRSGQINIILQEQIPKQTHMTKHETNNPFKFIDNEFSSFIGIENLKKTIKQIYAIKCINEQRNRVGLANSNQVLHMLFKGNPGTGKTTVARKLAHIFFEMNLLSKGHFIEADRADLVGEYIGQTAQKTRSIIKKAIGGILFIDEAYSLARGGEKDFGKEAIDIIVKYMEDHSTDFVLILAGYPHEMDYFLSTNPGLKSRFPFILKFDDFNVTELIDIAKIMLIEREYELSKAAEWKLRNHLQMQIKHESNHFSNGRYVRNVIEQAIRLHAVRLMYQSKSSSTRDLITLTEEDLQFI